jgi:hypothetical protein
MKKNTRLLLILAAVLVLCVAVYAAVSLSDKGAEDTEPVIRLNDLTDVKTVTIKNSKGEMEFINEGDSWSYTGYSSVSVDPTKLASVKQAVMGLTALREIDSADTLGAYGLDDSGITVTADDGNGNVFTILIGKEVPTGEGRYALISGAEKLFIIASDLYDAVCFDIDEITLTQ